MSREAHGRLNCFWEGEQNGASGAGTTMAWTREDRSLGYRAANCPPAVNKAIRSPFQLMGL